MHYDGLIPAFNGRINEICCACVCVFFARKTAALLYRKEKHFDLAGK